jgi:hypothetical protein
MASTVPDHPKMPSGVTQLVALLQNIQTRSDEAVQQKLNALADGLADLMAALGEDKPGLHQDLVELRKAVGLEDREPS